MSEAMKAACSRLAEQLSAINKVAGDPEKTEVACAAVKEIETFTAGVVAGVTAAAKLSKKQDKPADEDKREEV